ncbi:hypothetical protein N624_1841 [Levilactobacillus brevis]|nr:hypothetical protein N624_1841 [Levilactobacillus brevis]
MMSQKQDDPTSKEQESHPWDSSFADDRDDQGNLSRTKMRRQNHSNTMVTVILIAIIVVIAAASLVLRVSTAKCRESASKYRKGGG